MRILIVGDPGITHLGGHLLAAARAAGFDAELADVNQAFAGPRWRQKAAWWLQGHRPPRLHAFSAHVVREAKRLHTDVLLTTGLAPVDADALAALAPMGVARLNFSTDDPWNPAHHAPWFLRALPHYDHVFTPRRANAGDFSRAGVPEVSYLPFGFNPAVHFDAPLSDADRARFGADVMLAGGADPDRVAIVAPLLRAGVNVALFGGYWDRYPETRDHGRGFLGPEDLRAATRAATVSLGLVRRANRDGHAMRTFEVPAMGGCLLAERTDDHRAFFGAPGESVVYFDGPGDVVQQVTWLLEHPAERDRLTRQAHHRITSGGHTYEDRLRALLHAAHFDLREDRHRRPRPLSRV